MKLTAELNQEEHTIDFRREGERVTALIDGRRCEVVVREVERDAYLLISEGRVHVCRVEKNRAQADSFQVYVGNQDYSLTLFDPKRLRGGHAAGVHGHEGAARIIAPMPGKIVRVLVEQGAPVKAGDGIIVVEAMKMQNEMKSPRDGVVTELHTASGATVNAGDVLAVIEGMRDEG